MNRIINFEVWGKDLGQGMYVTDDMDKRAKWSLAFFCPACGEIWARARVDREPFYAFARHCDRHTEGIYWEFNGSLWMDWERDYQDSMPRAVLERELEIHLTAAERRYA